MSYILDWAAADLDGTTTLSGGLGNVGVTIDTPPNAEGKSWDIGFIDGDPNAVRSVDVRKPTELNVTFDRAVANVAFEIYDIDAGANDWDDKVTVIAKDANGNAVEIKLSDLIATHEVTETSEGTIIEGEGSDKPSIEGPGAPDSVTVNIPGPITSLQFIHDNGADFGLSGTVGLSDLSFEAVDMRDGIVSNDDDGDLIDEDYVGDPDGDFVDGEDALFPIVSDDDDIIDAKGGNDTILSGDGTDIVLAGTGDDVVDAGDGVDLVFGGEGDDTIDGGKDSDLLVGGKGNDEISGGSGKAEDFLFGLEGDDTLDGGKGDDIVDGGEGADSLSGGKGDDLFLEVNAGDSIDGGAGQDTVVIDGPALVSFDEDDPTKGTINFYDLNTAQVTGTAEFSGIETFKYVELDPNATPDDAPGATAAATSVSLPLTPGPDSSSDGVVDGTDGDDLIDLDYLGDPEGDRIDNEDAILPGEQPNDDIVEAGAGNDTVDGVLGDDDISAGTGDDLVFGNVGDDVIRGEEGNDTLEGNAGTDQIDGGEGDDSIDGGADQDVLVGGSGDDTIDGGDDDDFIEGDSGDDLLRGGAGNDLITGGDGNDTISLSDTPGDDELDFVLGGADRDLFVNVGANDLIIGGETGDDFDTIDTAGFGQFGVDWTVNYTNDDKASESGEIQFLDGSGNVTGAAEFIEIEAICFTPGSRILTPRGEVLAEDLTVGDKVITRDNGVQEIAWYGQSLMNAARLEAQPHLRPILIRAGALGNGLPERDLMVSPQHRVLVTSEVAELYFGEREVLVAAKHLVNGTTIIQAPVPQTTYIHFMCERHEVVLSDGAWSESFQPGEFSLNGIGHEQRDEIIAIFPELATEAGLKDYAAARRSLKKHEALLLAH